MCSCGEGCGGGRGRGGLHHVSFVKHLSEFRVYIESSEERVNERVNQRLYLSFDLSGIQERGWVAGWGARASSVNGFTREILLQACKVKAL